MKDDLSYIRGAHTLKFGYAFESQRANGFGQQNIAGQATLQLSRDRGSGRHGFHKRQFVRFVSAGGGGQRSDRNHSLSAADVRVSRVLRAGRLARQQEADRQPGAAL